MVGKTPALDPDGIRFSKHPGDCDRELSVTEQPAWRQGRRRGSDHPDWGPDGQRRRQCFGLVRGDAKPAAALARPRLAHEFGQIIPPQAPNDRGLLRHSHAAFIAPGPKVRIRFPPAESLQTFTVARQPFPHHDRAWRTRNGPLVRGQDNPPAHGQAEPPEAASSACRPRKGPGRLPA
jgi:hypothetical protein